ncbi:MAG: YjjG family noncanonical pyrimidine nucleotidase [Candidatus Cloacimonetes bacterium]|nr:YjjG family noncanonical pyrimidine nucleotidase [Candidatus Cloacimonadota bacterium]
MSFKYKLVLFDADGTLFDFDASEKEAFKKTCEHFEIYQNVDLLHKQYEIINRAIWRDFELNKISSTELRVERFRRFFSSAELHLNAADFSEAYLINLSKGNKLIEGAESVVKLLYGKCELALVTNGLADVQIPRFGESVLAKYFDHIFISDLIGHAKPHPEFFKQVFLRLPFKNSAIIVGDNLLSDIKGGNDFRIDTCWFNQNKCTNKSGIIPTYEISDLSELVDLLS